MDTKMSSKVKGDQITFNRGTMVLHKFRTVDSLILVIRRIRMLFKHHLAKVNHLKWHHLLFSKMINLTSATLTSKVTWMCLNLIDLKKNSATTNTIKDSSRAGGKIHKFRVIQTLMKLCNMKFSRKKIKTQYHKSTLYHPHRWIEKAPKSLSQDQWQNQFSRKQSNHLRCWIILSVKDQTRAKPNLPHFWIKINKIEAARFLKYSS